MTMGFPAKNSVFKIGLNCYNQQCSIDIPPPSPDKGFAQHSPKASRASKPALSIETVVWDFGEDDNKKNLEMTKSMLDIKKVWWYGEAMIIEKIRKQIKICGKTRYQISKDTDIDQAVLCKILQGADCKTATADILLKYFGLKLVSEKSKRAKK